MTNCTNLCIVMMRPDGMTIGPSSYGWDPQYAKCYRTDNAIPMNGIRLAFPSQIGTTDVDPLVPQITPITNVSACEGIHCSDYF